MILPILFIIFIIFTISGGFYVSYNPLEVNCLGCDTNGWYYKCAPNSGKGTETCSTYLIYKEKLNKIYDELNSVKKELDIIPKLIADAKRETDKVLNELSKIFEFNADIPPLTLPNIPDLNIEINSNPIDEICKAKPFDKVCNNGKLFSIRPFEPVMNAANAGINEMKKGLQKTNDAINKAMEEIKNMFKGFMNEIVNGLNKIIEEILKPWNQIKKEIDRLIDEVEKIGKLVANETTPIAKEIALETVDKIIPFNLSIPVFTYLILAIITLPFLGGLLGTIYPMYETISIMF